MTRHRSCPCFGSLLELLDCRVKIKVTLTSVGHTFGVLIDGTIAQGSLEGPRCNPQSIFTNNFANCIIIEYFSAAVFLAHWHLPFASLPFPLHASFRMPISVSPVPVALLLLFCRPVVYLFESFVCPRYRLIAFMMLSGFPERRVLRTLPRRFRRGGLSLHLP